jgi:ATP:ADP antiporter, AAA family
MQAVPSVHRLLARLRRSLAVEPGEGLPALLLGAFLLLGMATVICLKAVSDSVFLSEFNAKRLPYVDLAVTLLVGVAVNYYLRWAQRIALVRLIHATQLFIGTSLLLFWALLKMHAPLTPALLYVWVGVFTALIPSQVWSLAGLIFNTRQAKRLFALVGGGGILGAALGGSFAGAVGPWIGAEQLLPVSACLTGVAGLCVWRLDALSPAGAPERRDAPEQSSVPILESLRVVWANPYLRLIAFALFASTIAGTLVKFQYKAVLQSEIGADRDALTSFSGYFYGYIAVLSFFFHTLFTSKLLRRLGVSWCLLILPLSLLMGMTSLLFAATLVAAMLARGGDQAFRHSIDRSSNELLLVPTPTDLRNRVKSFLDIAVSRAADGAASLILVVLLLATQAQIQPVSIAGLVCVAIWISLLWKLRGEYVRTLRTTIERPNLEAEELLAKLAESGPSEELAAGLKSSDRRDLEAAVGWLQFQSASTWRAQLATLLGHDSPVVRRKVMAALLEHDVDGCQREVLDYLRREGEIDERWRALEYLQAHGAAELEEALPRLLREPGLLTPVVAAWILARPRRPESEDARERFSAFVEQATSSEDPSLRAAAALLLGRANGEAASRLGTFLRDPEPSVVHAALDSAGRLRPWGEVDQLVGLLEDRRYSRPARRALAAFGEPILERLSAALRDGEAPPELQRQAARVVGRIGGRDAARYLLAYLRRPQQAAREDCLRALTRMRVADLDLRFDRWVVQRLVETALERFYALAALRQTVHVDTGAAAAFLRRALSERMMRAREEALVLLGLVYPPREMRDARSRLASGSLELQSNAVEFLDSRLLGNPVRPALLPALEPHDEDRLIGVGRELFRLGPLPYATVMRRLLDDSDNWLRACACHAAAEAGVVALAARIAALESAADPILREVAVAAGSRLRAAS